MKLQHIRDFCWNVHYRHLSWWVGLWVRCSLWLKPPHWRIQTLLKHIWKSHITAAATGRPRTIQGNTSVWAIWSLLIDERERSNRGGGHPPGGPFLHCKNQPSHSLCCRHWGYCVQMRVTAVCAGIFCTVERSTHILCLRWDCKYHPHDCFYSISEALCLSSYLCPCN